MRAYLWASPNTAVGLLIALLSLPTGTRLRVVDGVIEAHGGLVAWLLRRVVPLPGGACALTLGHVVLGVSQAALDITRDHERIHVRQYERWGPAFVPAYFIASGWVWARGARAYHDNPFEREACQASRPQSRKLMQ